MHINATKEEIYQRGGWLDKLMETAFDSSILFDSNFRVINCSKTSAELCGLTVEQKVGMHLNDINTLYGDCHEEFELARETGTIQRNIVTIIKNKQAVTTVIPIKENDAVIALLGMTFFRGASVIKTIAGKMNSNNDSSEHSVFNEISRKNIYTYDDFVGRSPAIIQMLKECKYAANSIYPVLITGETGTGKEILASAIHSSSIRTAHNPYIKVNCTSIPDPLIESEFFGHEKGAFTGATALKKGKFEIADGGSILLDEIGDMQFSLQSKLLRALEEKEFERVGGNKMIPLNARIITSTNKNLKELCEANKFRVDLYYRLNTFEINIPPLRERREDIPILIDHLNRQNGYELDLSPQALNAMIEYHWPGNVRQLKSILQRVSVIIQGNLISVNDITRLIDTPNLKQINDQCQNSNSSGLTSDLTINDLERKYIIRKLSECNMNITETAKALGISRRTLYNKISKYNIKLEYNAY